MEKEYTLSHVMNANLVHPTIAFGWPKYNSNQNATTYNMFWVINSDDQGGAFWSESTSKIAPFDEKCFGLIARGEAIMGIHPTMQSYKKDETIYDYICMIDVEKFGGTPPATMTKVEYATKTTMLMPSLLPFMNTAEKLDCIVDMPMTSRKILHALRQDIGFMCPHRPEFADFVNKHGVDKFQNLVVLTQKTFERR